MRTFVAIFVAAGLLAATAGAQTRSAPTLSLSISTAKVLYGHAVTLTGKISSGEAGSHVAIYAKTYNSSKQVRIHITTTGANGRYVVKARPSIATTYEAHWSTATSRSLTVGLEPRVSAIEVGDGRIWVQIMPAHFDGRSVQLQHQLSNGTWDTLTRKALTSYSTAVFDTLPATTRIRVAMSVNQAGAGYLAAMSHPFRYTAYTLTLMPKSFRVGFGSSTMLSGHLINAGAGQPIAIDAWRYGHSAPVRVATVMTNAQGAWNLRVSPKLETTYQAHMGTTESSARMTVGVAPKLTISELANGKVSSHVTAGRSLRGKMLQLQRLMPGGIWHTIMKQPIALNGSAIFGGQLPSATLRTALSVNQAGVGLLGGFSSRLHYQAT